MAAARHQITLAELIDVQVDRLLSLRQVAADERRSHGRTEQLLDGLNEVGGAIRRMARG